MIPKYPRPSKSTSGQTFGLGVSAAFQLAKMFPPGPPGSITPKVDAPILALPAATASIAAWPTSHCQSSSTAALIAAVSTTAGVAFTRTPRAAATCAATAPCAAAAAPGVYSYLIMRMRFFDNEFL